MGSPHIPVSSRDGVSREDVQPQMAPPQSSTVASAALIHVYYMSMGGSEGGVLREPGGSLTTLGSQTGCIV